MKIFQHWLTFAIVFFGLIHIIGCKPTLMVEDQMHSVEVSENFSSMNLNKYVVCTYNAQNLNDSLKTTQCYGHEIDAHI